MPFLKAPFRAGACNNMKLLSQLIEMYLPGTPSSEISTTLGSAFLLIGMSVKKVLTPNGCGEKARKITSLENDMWAIE